MNKFNIRCLYDYDGHSEFVATVSTGKSKFWTLFDWLSDHIKSELVSVADIKPTPLNGFTWYSENLGCTFYIR